MVHRWEEELPSSAYMQRNCQELPPPLLAPEAAVSPVGWLWRSTQSGLGQVFRSQYIVFGKILQTASFFMKGIGKVGRNPTVHSAEHKPVWGFKSAQVWLSCFYLTFWILCSEWFPLECQYLFFFGWITLIQGCSAGHLKAHQPLSCLINSKVLAAAWRLIFSGEPFIFVELQLIPGLAMGFKNSYNVISKFEKRVL